MAYEAPDHFTIKILDTVLSEELRGEPGVTPYQIMRKLGLYPSFLYKNIKVLERRNYLVCKEAGRGKKCSTTVGGLLAFLKVVKDYDKYVYLFFRKLGFGSPPMDLRDAKTLLSLIIDGGTTPKDIYDLFVWSLLHCENSVVAKFLKALSGILGITLVMTPHMVYVKRNGTEICTCRYSNCGLEMCKLKLAVREFLEIQKS
ncbi:hypothetical protein [Pyrobaculum neutrophilum]|uniref:Uncharacterized protein n=1 Tax=Pyrobaculum neutrophilum (strain DSM 2338 / JCM 9278 / NBRC 100436 / V24Sta) TaxID=444157 RepID=B1YBQ6_PYRNV|nr:hypothetical protein [Pyrobaculum neutrophilum]ACB39290.1 conserved hypothetical protein [Pyrobaculum neutrophilum V24Sta]